jgi:flagellin
MIINHNMMAMNTHRQLGINATNGAKSIEKLSSGLRINRAGDDAAGLAISEKMRGQIRGLNQASRNSQDAISLIQTAEGALSETHSILQRMRELSVQASNDTNTEEDRTSLQEEINQLTKEIDRIANTTEFNTKKLLNGDLEGSMSLSEKAGQLKVEGNFANGSIVISDGGANISKAFTSVAGGDVIRIRLLKDVAAGGTISSGAYSATSIFGTNAAISSGDVVISLGTGATSVGATTNGGDFTVGLDFSSGGLEAGDVITITIGSYRAQSDGSAEDGARFQIGANGGQEMELNIGKMTSGELNIRQSNGDALDVTDKAKASMAIELYNKALSDVSSQRSALGAVQNRLEHTISNIDTSSENLQASESRIRDVDMAKEMMEYSKNNILQQAAQAMLAQANQAPQGVLSLLR